MTSKAEKENHMYEAVLDNMEIAIYVSDLETNTLLYVNKSLQHAFFEESLIGDCCWEALYNTCERCDSCPIPYLLKNPGKSHRRSICNDILEKTFWTQSSIIPWLNGKLAHLCCIVDTTIQSHEYSDII